MDPIKKYILSEKDFGVIDKELDKREKKIEKMPKDSASNFRKMMTMQMKEIMNSFMFEYKSNCPPDHTKDPKTGKCVKNPYDEEIEGKEDYDKRPMGGKVI